MYYRPLQVFQISQFKAATTNYNVNCMVYIHIPIRLPTESLVLTQSSNFIVSPPKEVRPMHTFTSRPRTPRYQISATKVDPSKSFIMKIIFYEPLWDPSVLKCKIGPKHPL